MMANIRLIRFVVLFFSIHFSYRQIKMMLRPLSATRGVIVCFPGRGE